MGVLTTVRPGVFRGAAIAGEVRMVAVRCRFEASGPARAGDEPGGPEGMPGVAR
jgi:hypothetical protein